MSATGEQDRHRPRLDPGQRQPVEDCRQDHREPDLAGGIRYHDNRRSPAGGKLAERQTVDRVLQRTRDEASTVDGAARRRWQEGSDLEPTKIDGDGVAGVR